MLLQVNQLVDDSLGQLIGVVRRQVDQATVLAPTLDQFVRIVFRSVGWEVFGRDFRMLGQVGRDDLGLAMHRTAIPQHGRAPPRHA